MRNLNSSVNGSDLHNRKLLLLSEEPFSITDSLLCMFVIILNSHIYLIKCFHLWRKPTMDTQDLLINDLKKGKVMYTVHVLCT